MAIATTDPLCARLAEDLDGAFPELVVGHQQLVYGVAVRVVGESSAEDVAQEVFVRVYRTLKRYPRERIRELRLRPWLARITLNLARNAIRGRREHADVAELEVGGESSPHQRVQARDERRMWARLLAGLPPRYRLPVALRHIEDMSYAEIAETLGKPVGSVKSDVHRGIQLLRAAYDAEQRGQQGGMAREAS